MLSATLVLVTLVVLARAQTEPCGLAALPPVFGRILNAPIAAECKWPWMVAIRLGNGDVPARMCAGVLVGRDKVITTASCVTAQPVHSVVVGENNILEQNEVLSASGREMTKSVSIMITHPNHLGRGYDLAVLRLSSPVDYNSCALPACLPEARQPGECHRDVMQDCTFAGWGLYTDKNFHVSHRLREANGTYYGPRVCEAIYAYGRNNITPRKTVCIEPKVQSQRPCGGDSGGMVSCRVDNTWELVSLINYPSCQDFFPSLGVDLRDPEIRNFIDSN